MSSLSTTSSISASNLDQEISHATRAIDTFFISTNTTNEKVATSTQAVLNNPPQAPYVCHQSSAQTTSSGPTFAKIPAVASQGVKPACDHRVPFIPIPLFQTILGYLPDLDRASFLEASHPLNTVVLNGTFRGKLVFFAQHDIREAIRAVIEAYNKEMTLLEIRYCQAQQPFPPKDSFPITSENVATAFSLPAYVTGAAEKITELDLSWLKIFHPAVLELLSKKFPHVKKLNLSHCDTLQFKAETGKAIGMFKELQTLIIEGVNFSESVFFDFLPESIVNLSLANSILADMSLPRAFKRLNQLKELDIFHVQGIENQLATVPQSLRKLKLHFDSNSVDACLEALFQKNLAQLEELDISLGLHDEKNIFLAGKSLRLLPQSIRKLTCQNQSFFTDNLSEGLSRASSLEELDISGTSIFADHLRSFPYALVKFSCRDCAINDITLRQLFRCCSRLEELDISGTNVTGEYLKFAPRTLIKLNCSRCQNLTEANLEEGLKILTQLKELNISGTNITGGCLQFVSPTLLKFDGSQCSKLSDDALLPLLARAKNLSELNVSTTKIDGSCLKLDLPALLKFSCARCSSFYCSSTSSELAHMPNLQELDISFNKETFDLSEQMVEKFPHCLTTLHINGYPQDAIDQLRLYGYERWPRKDANGLSTLTIEGENND